MIGSRARIAVLAALLAAGAVLLAAAPALAVGPPIVSGTAFSEVTESSVKLQASVNPNGKKTIYSFQYITEAAWQDDGEQFGEGTQSTSSAAIEAELSVGHPVEATLGGLAPATAYRARLLARNSQSPPEGSPGETVAFATYPAAPVFGPCENDAFRSGAFAPPGAPSAGLPDCRAYEQATPVDKNGGDVTGTVPFVKAAAAGGGVTFASTAGVPGGVGAQELPLYLASRAGAGAGWGTQGLLPPAALGQRAKVLGWTPDLSHFFLEATVLGSPNTTALFARPGEGGAPTEVTPYLAEPRFAYAGSSADGATAIFESTSGQLGTTPPGIEGRSNVYAWNGSSLSLASVFNDGTPPAKGAFAGPYDWVRERRNEGGAAGRYYTQDEGAVAADGSVFFTAADSGRLFERLHPTQPQSALDGGGECTEPARACTIDVSPSRRTPPDPGGERPRAFQAATADGQTAFFTSSEELTNDANTGPEAPEPKLGRATLHGEEPASEELPELLKAQRAVGVAIAGERVYWADPVDGEIGRAHLNGSSAPNEVEPDFIEPGETCFETHPKTEPETIHCAPSSPRYIAVANGHVYWTNTGPLGGETIKNGGYVQIERPMPGAGTIGRAALDGSGDLVPGTVKPEFIKGASNPQGIAANPEHLYWVNSCSSGNPTTCSSDFESIARAGIEGDEVDQNFIETPNGNRVALVGGLAVDATDIYWVGSWVEPTSSEDYVLRLPLGGGSYKEADRLLVGYDIEPRGLAIDASHLYWAAQGTGAVARLPLADFEPSKSCAEIPTCDPNFLHPGGALAGLATDPAQEHLFWSVDGETPPHPGNDLYRYQAAGDTLTDLTPDAAEENGAEVQGVLGASKDGSRLYFVANGDLDGPGEASPRACKGRIGAMSGECNLYLWEEDGTPTGAISFVARLDASGTELNSDARDWVPTIIKAFIGTAQKTSQLSPDGATLLFRSQRRLTAYDNKGVAELYRYRVGSGLVCVSCDPTGTLPTGLLADFSGPRLGSIQPGALRSTITMASESRNLADGGRRVFFETPAALAAADTDGLGGCPLSGTNRSKAPVCQDVYEWEAPGAGVCEEGAPSYSPANGGCLYLLSDGGEASPAFFADASASGDDAFLFTRAAFVGQDQDQLLDVYDARVLGGLAAQNPTPQPPCESPDACRPGPEPPPQDSSPATPGFQGAGNVREKPCRKGWIRRHGRCVKKPHRHHHRRPR